MAYVYFDSGYAPGGFLIVADDASPYSDDPSESNLIQSDWDWPSVATSMGCQACKCGGTDGTVECKKCKRTVSDMMSEAYDFIEAHADEPFDTLDDYLAEKEQA
jgi:hypothetical protein